MSTPAAPQPARLRRVLGLWDLVFYGIILIQPTAPMPLFGVVSEKAQGHVVTAVLIAMVAMLFTGLSYGRMAAAYPSAGSAFTYVGREFNPTLGYITGWSMVLDYVMNPLICTIWCSKAAGNFVPEIPYPAWAVFFAALFTLLNLRGVKASARINEGLAAGMGVVILIFFYSGIRYVLGQPAAQEWTRPFYDPATFRFGAVFTGTSIAALTYIGFDGVSTLAEEVKNPRQNVLRATMLVCLITGVLASAQVYLGQLIWPASRPFPDVDTAFSFVAGEAGGAFLFTLVNFTLLVATIGSGTGTQLAVARLLYGMGRSDALPKRFFGVIEPKRGVPRNNVLAIGVLALVGALTMSYSLGAQMINFGALLAFMGVNAAAFTRYYWRAERKRWSMSVPPAIGFALCLFIWLNLEWPAKLAGGAWMAAGIAYGAYRTKGFRRELVNFEIPQD